MRTRGDAVLDILRENNSALITRTGFRRIRKACRELELDISEQVAILHSCEYCDAEGNLITVKGKQLTWNE